jgi:hypothetical protein
MMAIPIRLSIVNAVPERNSSGSAASTTAKTIQTPHGASRAMPVCAGVVAAGVAIASLMFRGSRTAPWA